MYCMSMYIQVYAHEITKAANKIWHKLEERDFWKHLQQYVSKAHERMIL